MPLRFFLLIGLAVLGAAGCGAGSDDAPSALIYSRGTDADSLDPLDTSLGESAKVITNVFDTLVTYDDDSLEIVPSLAENWSISDDKRTWTFQLREGVKFHDGTPLDAAAVVFNFERLLQEDHPHLYGAKRPYRPDFAMIESVETVGPLEVKFTLSEPSAVFLNNLAMFTASIAGPEALEEHGRRFAERPVGTGPFQFEQWDRDQRLVLRAYDDHWRGAPQVERVIFTATPENAIRAMQIQRGAAHITDNLPPAEIDALAKAPGVKIQRQEGLNVGYLTIQTQKPPLNRPKVRRAIWQAIDKRRLIEVAYSGRGEPAVTLVPPTMWGHAEGLEDRPYDPDAARSLLEQAAAEHDFELPLELDLYYMKQARPYMQQPLQIAVFIRDSLEKIGMRVNLVPNDFRQHFQRLSAGEHDLGLAGWSSDNADPDNFLYTLLAASNINDAGGNNTSRYDNPDVNQLLAEAQRELDRQKRAELYRRAQGIIFQDAPVVPLVHTEVNIAHREELKGYDLHPASIVRLREARLEK